MITVNKTYKILIGGQFIRSESGRAYLAQGVNVPLSSKKDMRNAVVAAKGALSDWSNRTAYNRGQILYRAAEMLESRRGDFLQLTSSKELDASIASLVYFAGAADKLTQLGGNVNAVAGPYFNFTVPEPMGVIALFPRGKSDLLSLTTAIAAAIAGGNTSIALLSEEFPLAGLLSGEVWQNSDVPAGVVNMLSGSRAELLEQTFKHRGIDGLDTTGLTDEQLKQAQVLASDSVKRLSSFNTSGKKLSPRLALQWLELKTVWHPIGK